MELQVLLGEFDDLVETGRIVNRDFRQGLPIQLGHAHLQAVNELAIAHAARTAGSVDADDPQSAELPFPDAAVAEGVDTATDQRDDRLAVEIVATRSEEHTSELQSRFGISYAVF